MHTDSQAHSAIQARPALGRFWSIEISDRAHKGLLRVVAAWALIGLGSSKSAEMRKTGAEKATEANSSKANSPEATPSKAVTSKHTTPKGTMSKGTTSKGTASKATASKATASKATASKATASKATASKAMSSKSTSAKVASSRANPAKEDLLKPHAPMKVTKPGRAAAAASSKKRPQATLTIKRTPLVKEKKQTVGPHDWTKAQLAQLRDIERATPQYLFRAYHSNSGGGHLRCCTLNCTSHIVPHGWATSPEEHGVEPPRAPQDIKRADFHSNMKKHLHTVRDNFTDSVFSSWTPSLTFALAYCADLKESGSQNVHLAVIDREPYDGFEGNNDERLRAWHVPLLLECFKDDSQTKYEWEFLAFGYIGGPGFHSIPYQKLIKAGLQNIPALYHPKIWSVNHERDAARSSGFVNNQSTKPALRQMKKVAMEVPEDIAAPFVLALITRARRIERTRAYTDRNAWEGADYEGAFDDEEVKMVAKVLGEEPMWVMPPYRASAHDYYFRPERALTGMFPDYGMFIHLSARVRELQNSRGGRPSRATSAKKS